MSFTVRQARVYKGLTQLEMAQALGISEQTYRRYESSPGRMPVESLNRFSTRTGIPIEHIVTWRIEENQEDEED